MGIAEIFYPSEERNTKKLRFYEVFFESCPQLLIHLMIMMRLSIYNLKYIGTGVISFCSLLYVAADAIVFKKFEEEGTHFQVIWCILSLFIDCLFRALFFSFLLSSWPFDQSMRKLYVF